MKNDFIGKNIIDFTNRCGIMSIQMSRQIFRSDEVCV